MPPLQTDLNLALGELVAETDGLSELRIEVNKGIKWTLLFGNEGSEDAIGRSLCRFVGYTPVTSKPEMILCGVIAFNQAQQKSFEN